jgi:hypothetical protein
MRHRDRLALARQFLYANARLVDRAAFEVVFEGAPTQRLLRALTAYANPDGGLGHALEADLRTPSSQPLHCETALTMLRQCGVRDAHLAQQVCEFLARIGAPDEGLPAYLPGALDYPAAAHWQGGTGGAPSLPRLLGMVALLDFHGAVHPWLDRARERGRSYLTTAAIDEAHLLLYATQFAAVELTDVERRDTLHRLGDMLVTATYYVPDTPVVVYGLTPLHFAPRPDDPVRQLFDDRVIAQHLDDCAAAQQPDGGWPILFDPPSDAARLEWRGRWTVEALLALRAYGRI